MRASNLCGNQARWGTRSTWLTWVALLPFPAANALAQPTNRDTTSVLTAIAEAVLLENRAGHPDHRGALMVERPVGQVPWEVAINFEQHLRRLGADAVTEPGVEGAVRLLLGGFTLRGDSAFGTLWFSSCLPARRWAHAGEVRVVRRQGEWIASPFRWRPSRAAPCGPPPEPDSALAALLVPQLRFLRQGRGESNWMAGDSATLSTFGRAGRLPGIALATPGNVPRCPGSTDQDGKPMAEPGGQLVFVRLHLQTDSTYFVVLEARCRFIFQGAESRRGGLVAMTWEVFKTAGGWRLGRLLDQRAT